MGLFSARNEVRLPDTHWPGTRQEIVMLIRYEAAADIPAVRKIVEEAFPQPAEAKLVDQVRADGDAVIAAVALYEGVVIGFVMFSKMAAPFRALGLGPVAVKPVWQRKEIGSRLIRWGLEQAERAGWQGVFVLGDPRFYRRFGFDPALASGFVSPYAGPHFMARGLGQPLPATTGKIDYASAFRALG
jgi:putative acetyltransferase